MMLHSSLSVNDTFHTFVELLWEKCRCNILVLLVLATILRLRQPYRGSAVTCKHWENIEDVSVTILYSTVKVTKQKIVSVATTNYNILIKHKTPIILGGYDVGD